MANATSSLAGTTMLVTGATSGIGLETARALARRGAVVLVVARDASRGQAVVDELVGAGHAAELHGIDMASFAAVRQGAARIAARHPALDVLINNAAVVTRRRQLSPDGHELIWATNFLGAFLLTRLLGPLLHRAAAPRVVNVSSEAHRHARIHWEDLELEHGFRGYRAYAQSKLALVLFTRELARRDPALAVNAVHPGVIATRIWRAARPPIPWLLNLLLPSARTGAAPVLRLATAPELGRVSGRYFDQLEERPPGPGGLPAADAARLWDIAERATGTGAAASRA
jgi:retinol dehydrogenase 12